MRGYATPCVFASSVRKRLKQGDSKTARSKRAPAYRRKGLRSFCGWQEGGGMPEGLRRAWPPESSFAGEPLAREPKKNVKGTSGGNANGQDSDRALAADPHTAHANLTDYLP